MPRHPIGHWKTPAFLGALCRDHIDAPAVFDGPINGARFLAMSSRSSPYPRSRDIVILDNLGRHKGTAVRQAIRATEQGSIDGPIPPINLPPNNSWA
jgi:hypothetical protein